MLLSYIIFTNVASVFTVVISALDYLEADSLDVIIGWFSTFWVIILMLECLSIAVLLAFAWVQYTEHPGEPVGMELYTNVRLYWLACFSGRTVGNNNRTIRWWDRVPHWALPFLGTLCTVIPIFNHQSPFLSGGLCFAERVIFAAESFVLSNTLHKPVKPISTYVLCAVSSVLALVGLAMGSNCLILGRAVVFYLLRRALRKWYPPIEIFFKRLTTACKKWCEPISVFFRPLIETD
ncbi:unnamed protein product [Clonostachys rosea f. rosea IK726]|uniref:Uncharacterized protein n=1 Tax=Clonostachys rosea f. rosea IK726 TaxID=1349383 RepID=A0ACA9USC7_BIOOC|nr:unnamed protein product [Clonostachys rosea f. rosea IK726]